MKPVATLLAVLLFVSAGFAQVSERQPAKTISSLTYPAAFAITALHLVSSDPDRQETGKRLSDAIIMTGALTTALQHALTSPRPAPYEADRHGFPSGHTSLAFATAAALTEREPSAGWIAFPLAAATGWSREDLHRHTWAQVVGGAALGAYIGHLAGEGKLTIFGHNDSELPIAEQTAEHYNPAHRVGPAARLGLWSASF